MKRATHPLVVELTTLGADQKLKVADVAKALKVHPQSVTGYRTGRVSPPMRCVLAWAALVDATPEAVNSDGEVALRGDSLVKELASLRRGRGWYLRDVAERRHLHGTGHIAQMEVNASNAGLATYVDHLKAFGLTLRLARPTTEMVRPKRHTLVVAAPASAPVPDGVVLTMPKGGACIGTRVDMTPAPGDKPAEDSAREVCLGCAAYISCLPWARSIPEKDDPGGVLAAMTLAERQPSGSRTCSVCEATRSMADFAYTDDRRKDRRGECRTCVRQQARALQAVTKAKNRAAHAAAERVAA